MSTTTTHQPTHPRPHQAGQARVDVIFTEPTELSLGQAGRIVVPKRSLAVADLPVFEYAGLQGEQQEQEGEGGWHGRRGSGLVASIVVAVPHSHSCLFGF